MDTLTYQILIWCNSILQSVRQAGETSKSDRDISVNVTWRLCQISLVKSKIKKHLPLYGDQSTIRKILLMLNKLKEIFGNVFWHFSVLCIEWSRWSSLTRNVMTAVAYQGLANDSRTLENSTENEIWYASKSIVLNNPSFSSSLLKLWLSLRRP